MQEPNNIDNNVAFDEACTLLTSRHKFSLEMARNTTFGKFFSLQEKKEDAINLSKDLFLERYIQSPLTPLLNLKMEDWIDFYETVHNPSWGLANTIVYVALQEEFESYISRVFTSSSYNEFLKEEDDKEGSSNELTSLISNDLLEEFYVQVRYTELIDTTFGSYFSFRFLSSLFEDSKDKESFLQEISFKTLHLFDHIFTDSDWAEFYDSALSALSPTKVGILLQKEFQSYIDSANSSLSIQEFTDKYEEDGFNRVLSAFSFRTLKEFFRATKYISVSTYAFSK